MPGFTRPGVLFLGTIVPSEQSFLKAVFAGARAAGYGRFVEPAAGALAMSHLASQVGFPPGAIEASDVTLFSAIFGFTVSGQSLASLRIEAEGFTPEELLDPATALYALLLCRYLGKAEKTVYWSEVVRDLRLRREEVVADLDRQLARAREALRSLSYRPLDMFAHLEEAWDDPGALISLNPPTITAGFERFYDSGGRMRWAAPEYRVFDPRHGLAELAERALKAKALVIVYEEADYGQAHLRPVFVRGAALKAPGDFGPIRTRNAYLTANRPEEVRGYAQGAACDRPAGVRLEPSSFPILPGDWPVTEKSRLDVAPVTVGQATYYRALWTHRFLGASAGSGSLSVLLDGHVCGVFGYDASWLMLGRFGDFEEENPLLLMYGMTAPDPRFRLNKLLTRVALTRTAIAQVLPDLLLSRVNVVRTSQMTKYPESKEMRGVMKLEKRHPAPGGMFHLTYRAEPTDLPLDEVLWVWLKDETRYKGCRSNTA